MQKAKQRNQAGVFDRAGIGKMVACIVAGGAREAVGVQMEKRPWVDWATRGYAALRAPRRRTLSVPGAERQQHYRPGAG